MYTLAPLALLPECFQILEVEADIEEGEEGVDKLEEDQLHRHVDIVLLLGPANSTREYSRVRLIFYTVWKFQYF